MRAYIPKAGDMFVATERSTGRRLERGMPCVVTGTDNYHLKAVDSNGLGRTFNCTVWDIEQVVAV
jgi:hypothetical protein